MVQIPKYNPNDHEPNQVFDPLPAGWYGMQIIKSEVRPTRDQEGQYLWLELQIIESMHPDYKGRLTWDRLNLWNKNEQTVRIANGSLAAICQAIGHVGELEETEHLHGKPLAVKLKLRPADGKHDASNDVGGYDPLVKRFQTGAPVSATTASVPPGTGAVGTPAPPAGQPAWVKPK